MRDSREANHRAALVAGVTDRRGEVAGLGKQALGDVEIALVFGKVSGSEQRLRAVLREVIAMRGECGVEPAAAVGDEAAHGAEPPDRPGEAEDELRMTVGERPLDRGTDVPAVLVQSVQPDILILLHEVRLGHLAQGGHYLGVRETGVRLLVQIL